MFGIRIRDGALMLALLGVTIMIGAELFGHRVVGATVFQNPPKSFAMFQGEYGYDSSGFWQQIPPLTLVAFLIATALNWNSERRKLLTVGLFGFILISVVSIFLIFPAFEAMTSADPSGPADAALAEKAKLWTMIGYTRWFATVVVALMMMTALMRRD